MPIAAIAGAVPAASPANHLVVVLPPDSERHEHLLQLRYQFADRGPHNGSISLEAPKWLTKATIRRTYWQLLVPSDEQVLKASSDLSAEYDWVWNPAFFGLRRVPLKDDAQLEQWIGLRSTSATSDTSATNLAARPTTETSDRLENVNRYLFSTAGQGGRYEVVLMRRWLLLLFASAAALAIGLAMIYFSALRQLRVLAAIAAIVIIVAIVYPDLTILIAQSAALGLALIVAALGYGGS